MTSAGQLPLNEWTNVAPAYRLAPFLGSLALPLSLALALALGVYALRPARSDGASLLLLTVASCLVLSTVHLFWWLSPIIVAVAYYGARSCAALALCLTGGQKLRLPGAVSRPAPASRNRQPPGR